MKKVSIIYWSNGGNVEVIALLRKMKKEMDGDKKNEKK